jgi:hypothetical protein
MYADLMIKNTKLLCRGKRWTCFSFHSYLLRPSIFRVASNIAEQAVAQIRVVQAFVGEERAMWAYAAALGGEQRIGYRVGYT